AISCFHMENRDVKTFSRNSCQAAVSISQYQNSIRVQLYHKIIGFSDNVSYGVSQVFAYSGQIVVRLTKSQPFDKEIIQLLVIVLSGVAEILVKVNIAKFNYFR